MRTIIAACVMALATAAQASTPSLIGTVTLAPACVTPVAGLMVHFAGPGLETVVTAADGSFQVYGMPPARYTVTTPQGGTLTPARVRVRHQLRSRQFCYSP